MTTRDEVITWATGRGWKLDRWGHLKKEFPGGTRRLKLSRIAARMELDCRHGWVRLASGYYKDITIQPDGTLGGLRR